MRSFLLAHHLRLPSPRSSSFAVLVLVAGVGPIALDSYLPAMPQMRVSLHSTAALIQLTVTGFIIGMAIGQLLSGPISDGVGRRPAILIPAAIFTAASAACATAVNADVLIAIRPIHGMAAGATAACGRAVVSDRYRGTNLAVRFGTLMAITQVVPVIAPGLGSAVLSFGTWRAIFWGVTLLGLIMIGWVVIGVPETLPPDKRHGASLAATARRMRDLFLDWNFSKHVAVVCLTMFGFFAYVGGASFVLQTTYGISEAVFAVVSSVNAGLMVAGMIVFRMTVTRYGPRRLRAVGLGVATAATALLLFIALLGPAGPRGLAIPWLLLAVVAGSAGLVFPATTTLAQQAGDRARGTASSLQGGLGMLAGAIASPMTGFFGDASLLPMAALMTIGFGLSSLMLIAITRSERSPGVQA